MSTNTDPEAYMDDSGQLHYSTIHTHAEPIGPMFPKSELRRVATMLNLLADAQDREEQMVVSVDESAIDNALSNIEQANVETANLLRNHIMMLRGRLIAMQRIIDEKAYQIVTMRAVLDDQMALLSRHHDDGKGE